MIKAEALKTLQSLLEVVATMDGIVELPGKTMLTLSDRMSSFGSAIMDIFVTTLQEDIDKPSVAAACEGVMQVLTIF